MAAEYKNFLKRGTECLQLTPHFKDTLKRYTRRQLRANFFGPKEWYFLAQKKMQKFEDITYSSVKEVASKSSSNAFGFF
jgi:hypothetical protein